MTGRDRVFEQRRLASIYKSHKSSEPVRLSQVDEAEDPEDSESDEDSEHPMCCDTPCRQSTHFPCKYVCEVCKLGQYHTRPSRLSPDNDTSAGNMSDNTSHDSSIDKTSVDESDGGDGNGEVQQESLIFKLPDGRFQEVPVDPATGWPAPGTRMSESGQVFGPGQ